MPNARRAAEIIQAEHPYVEFTSGRRDMLDQARAMAQNVVASGPGWLVSTYSAKQPKMVSILGTHISENPGIEKDVLQLTDDFNRLMHEYLTAEFQRFPHFQGRAFDIRWPRLPNSWAIDFTKGEQICYTIANLKPIHRVPMELMLKKEGGIYVIHSQYTEGPVSVEI